MFFVYFILSSRFLQSVLKCLNVKGKTYKSDEERDFQGHRLSTYNAEVRLLREERDEGSRRERQIVRDILNTWKNIRAVRSKNGFANTNVKIVVHKVSCRTHKKR